MVLTEEIEFIRRACGELGQARLTAFSTAAVNRVLTVYQVYGEKHSDIRGHDRAHAALVAIVRLLRRQPGVTKERVERDVDAAVAVAEGDLALVRERPDFGVAEAVAAEAISAVLFALIGWRQSSVEDCFNAAMTALEVDSVWAEETAEDVVLWDELTSHYSLQVRDIGELSDGDESDELKRYRAITSRAEREAMLYMSRMEALFKA